MPVQGDHEGNARERDWCRYKATNTKLTRERPRRSSQESGRRLSRSGAGVAKITRIRIRIHPDLTKISPTCKLSHSPTVPTGQAKQGVPRPPKIRQACKAMSFRGGDAQSQGRGGQGRGGQGREGQGDGDGGDRRLRTTLSVASVGIMIMINRSVRVSHYRTIISEKIDLLY